MTDDMSLPPEGVDDKTRELHQLHSKALAEAAQEHVRRCGPGRTALVLRSAA